MNNLRPIIFFFLCVAFSGHSLILAQKFEQLEPELRSPNIYRTASGAPGHAYWQQRVDYTIDVELDDDNQRIIGTEKITYHNNSNDALSYLWVQLDQNMRAKNSNTYKTEENDIKDKLTYKQFDDITGYSDFDGGHKISKVTDSKDNPLPFVINQTMMRVDLPDNLKSGDSTIIKIDWEFNINDRLRMGGRGGFEYFETENNYLYTITQWFPRMAVYSDNEGWQHKQFLGRGEFALEFGNYEVNITVPSNHIIASTGTLQNPEEVLTKTQRDRLEEAKKASSPILIITEKEATKNESTSTKEKRTWKFRAENVRDFAFGSSKKYIWDAQGVDIEGKTVMAMSYYLKESNPLYQQYSTKAVAHALEVYSKYTFPYPYSKAISVEARNGMEYPMICFNYGRPEKDGTYSERIKYGMISVIIHEVGHNYFPMIVNSDERQWTWMDEGLNSFVQFLAEQEWDVNYPSRRGPAHKIVPYMKGSPSGMRPIMTNSEQILQFGNNAYGKPATALNILRETIMGRELFDYAFKEYSKRWAFKHPTPEDFFRTMEDASGVDLDWFWKGWFYTTDHVDISITGVDYYQFNSGNPTIENPKKKKEEMENDAHISQRYNTGLKTKIETDPALIDFYNTYDPYAVSEKDIKKYKSYFDALDEDEKKLLTGSYHIYQVNFENVGGLVMPIIIKWNYKDGSSEVEYLPAEIWKLHEDRTSKVFVKKKEIASIQLDPYRETADTDEENNYYPKRIIPNRLELYKKEKTTTKNPMQETK